MAAFRAGIRWADLSTESFSRSKTAPGTASAALQMQADQADHSYAPGEAVVLPEFENSHAGMNQYFADVAVLGGDDSNKTGPATQSQGTEHAAAAGEKSTSNDKANTDCMPRLSEREGSSKMPGFRGLLVGAPSEGFSGAAAGGPGSKGVPTTSRRERRAPADMVEAATLTPAKRNRRISGAPAGSSAVVQNPQGAPPQDGSTSAAPESVSQRLPQSKRRKSTHSRRSAGSQFGEQSFSSINAAIVPHGQQGKRRSARGSDRRRSGGGRRTSENPGLLLPMGLQLPGLVSPMFMPVGLAPGTAAPLPGLLHPQMVQQQQARVNSSKEQQEQDDEEEWQRRECARMKDIAIGKATAGYRNFLKQVGTERRSDGDPVTPDAKLRCSKAQFQRAYQKWRKQLHQYDTVEDPAGGSTPTPAEAQAGSVDPCVAKNDEGNMVPRDAADQQDLEAILAFNKECELAGL